MVFVPIGSSCARGWTPGITAVEIRIENIGRGGGAYLTVLGYATEEELPPDVRKPIKHRMGEVFGAQLREGVNWY